MQFKTRSHTRMLVVFACILFNFALVGCATSAEVQQSQDDATQARNTANEIILSSGSIEDQRAYERWSKKAARLQEKANHERKHQSLGNFVFEEIFDLVLQEAIDD